MTARLAAGPEILLFEPDQKGHAREWIEHLIRWLSESSRAGFLSVVTHPDLAGELSQLAGRSGRSRIRIITMTPTEVARCNSQHLAVSGFARWLTMRRYLRDTRASHGLFLCIDHLSLPYGLGFASAGQLVSGILFRPSLHYEPGRKRRWKDRVRDVRKDILYRGMCRNSAIRTIWTLDPDFPAYAIKHYRGGEKIRPLPDPICKLPDKAVPAPEQIDDGPKRSTFLLFGVLTERKGIFNLLDALMRIEYRYASAMTVVLAGHVDPSIRDRLDREIKVLRGRRPELRLHLDNRHLPRDELAGYVANADIILAPYQRFVGSSGVMLWAADAGKPILTQSYGLLGRQVADYGLGLAVDTMNPSKLAAAMVSAMCTDPEHLTDSAGVNRFVASHSAQTFASRIMQDLLGFSFEDASISPSDTDTPTGTD